MPGQTTLRPSSFDRLRMRSTEKILMLSLSKHELVENEIDSDPY
jgi:hypothetical protein